MHLLRLTLCTVCGSLFLARLSLAAQPVPSVPLRPAIQERVEQTGPVLGEDEAISIALQNSPTLDIARRQMNVSLIESDRTRPQFLPEVNATGTQVARGPRVDLPGPRDDTVLPNWISRFEIEFRHPIYQFGAGKAAVRRSDAMAAAARAEYRRAELDLILRTREAYLGVLRAEAMVEVARRGVELAHENLRLTTLLRDQGFQAAVDAKEAERAVEEAETSLVQARIGVARARLGLNVMMGRDLDVPFRVAPIPPPQPLPGTSRELTNRALGRRPEVVALGFNIQAAEAGIRLARAQSMPRVSFEAAYALQTETALVPASGISAGLSVTMPIFNGPVRRYTVREAEERLGQLKSRLRVAEQAIGVEIEEQRLSMESARRRMQSAERAVLLAEDVFRIQLEKLKLGRAIQAEIMNAQVGLERALSDRAAAYSDLLLARARLERALGEGPSSPALPAVPESKEKEPGGASAVPAARVDPPTGVDQKDQH